ncbi:MAG: hypothetical protein LUH12_00965 [Bacteroides sp.]|nr:hypothetical protein [Bacteroides sp.]
MANFAVATNDETVSRGKELLEKYMMQGEKQGDALNRIFNIAEKNLESDQLTEAGVDATELDATLAHLRSIYAGAVSGRQELLDAHAREIEMLKERHQKAEGILQEKLTSMNESYEQMEKDAKADRDASELMRAQEDQMQARIEQLEQESKKSDKLILSLEEEKDRLQTELNKTTSLAQENVSLKEQLVSLQAELQQQKMEAERKEFALQKQLQNETMELKTKQLEEISRLNAEHSAEIKKLRSEYEADLQNQRNAYAALQALVTRPEA